MIFRRGDFIRATHKTAVEGLVHWNAPTTTGFKGTLEAGCVLVVAFDQQSSASGVAAIPVEKERYEIHLVSQEERSNAKYGGYSVFIPPTEVGTTFVLLTDGERLLTEFGVGGQIKASWWRKLFGA